MIKKPNKDDSSSFLSRWSQRKEEVRDQGQPSHIMEEIDKVEEATIPEVVSPATGRMITYAEEELDSESAENGVVLTDEDMPSIESLNEKSDFSGFMSSGVSEGLRKLALRKLFAGAGFNIRDGLDDYDDDFTNFPPLGDIITSDMKHQMELAEKRKKEAEEQAAVAEQEQAVEEVDETKTESEEELIDEQEEIVDADGVNDDSTQDETESV